MVDARSEDDARIFRLRRQQPNDDRAAEGPDDRDLIIRVAGGDRRALRELYDRHAGRLLAVARMFTRNQALAEEAVQETLMAVWRGANGYDPSRAAQSWLMSIARYKAIDVVRRESARAPSEESIQKLQISEYEDEELLENTSAARMILARLMETVDSLSRSLLQDAFYNGYSHGELADRYDLPVGTVKSRIRRALQSMKAQVNREDV